MELTNEIIERKGFKKVNNSMWRRDCITLQNGYTDEGVDFEINNRKKQSNSIEPNVRRMVV